MAQTKSKSSDIEEKVDKNLLGIAVAVLIVVLPIAGIISYNLYSDRIIKTAVKSMNELVSHDKKTLEASINSKWTVLQGIGDYFRDKKFKTTAEFQKNVVLAKPVLDCRVLSFMASDGTKITSEKKIYKDDEMLNLFTSHPDKFIIHKKNENTADEANEVLLVGVKIEPFVVEEKTYCYAMSQLDISIFENEIISDIYDGEGYSVIFNKAGDYILKSDRSTTTEDIDNVYKTLSNNIYEDGWTLSDVKKNILHDKSFVVELEKPNGKRCIGAFTPIVERNWYFALIVSRSVFEKQTMSLLKITVVIIVLMLAIIFLAILYVVYRHSKQIKKEKQHQAELSRALLLANQANNAKTAFLSNMSHDIRTPMNAIIGFTALATTNIDNKDRIKDYLSKIMQSSTHLLSLINDVLDMSHIESGKMTLEEKPENLADILHTLRNIVQADIHSKQLELFIDTVDVVDEDIYCDKLRLNQVLLNILTNAMKFTPAGGTISIRISERQISQNGYGVYEFRIKDTGIGMSKEFIDSIFEPFTREQSASVSGIQGTGLGMAIAKNIVDMMNGKISVTSEKGKGSEFVIVLKFRFQNTHKEIKQIASLSGVRSLVVDDDMNSCQSIAQMLRQLGLRSEWSMYGKEAVARTEESIKIGDAFFVYIIDWSMPDMNGIETARRIRKLVGSDAPIIILTAYDWSDIEEEALDAGVTDFVSKPLFLSDLHKVLSNACGEVDENDNEDDKIDVGDEIPDDLKGKRILLVEDNELNSEIAFEILTHAGFKVEEARDGSIAL